MTKLTMVIPGILMGLFLAPVVEASTQSAREVVCYERQDKSITRVLMKMTASGRISSLEVVTPSTFGQLQGNQRHADLPQESLTPLPI